MPVAHLVDALVPLQGGFVFGVTAPCPVVRLQPLRSYMIFSQAQSGRDGSSTHRSFFMHFAAQFRWFLFFCLLARLAHLAGSSPSILPFAVSSHLFFILQFSVSFRHRLLVGCRPLCRFLIFVFMLHWGLQQRPFQGRDDESHTTTELGAMGLR